MYLCRMYIVHQMYKVIVTIVEAGSLRKHKSKKSIPVTKKEVNHPNEIMKHSELDTPLVEKLNEFHEQN